MTKENLELIKKRTDLFLEDLIKVFEKHNLCIWSDDGGVVVKPYEDFEDAYKNREYFDWQSYKYFEEEFEKLGNNKDVHISDVCGDDTRIHNILKAVKEKAERKTT